MKLFKYLSVAALFFGLFACENELDPQVPSDAVAPELIGDYTGTYELKQSQETETFLDLVWSQADFKINVVNEYSVELDLATADFTNPVILATTKDTTKTLTVNDFNLALLDLGVTAGTAADVKIRIMANNHLASQTQEMNAKGYFSVIAWGIIGSATAGGWDADTDMEYIPADVNDPENTTNSSWVITTDLTSGEYKFRYNDEWDAPVGGNLGGGYEVVNGTDLVLESGGDNNKITEGNYTITLKLVGTTSAPTSATFDIVQNSAPEASPQDDKWGIIGNAYKVTDDEGVERQADWGDDDDAFLTFQSEIDEAYSFSLKTIILEEGGQFKFREGADWAVNFGIDGCTVGGDTENFTDKEGNFLVNTTKAYEVEMINDVANGTKTVNFITPDNFSYGIIGNAYEINGTQANWGDNEDIVFSYSTTDAGTYSYVINNIELRTGGEFKIRRDAAWSEAYGFFDVTAIEGDTDNITEFGGNFLVSESKTYKIEFKFNFIDNTRTIVFTAL